MQLSCACVLRFRVDVRNFRTFGVFFVGPFLRMIAEMKTLILGNPCLMSTASAHFLIQVLESERQAGDPWPPLNWLRLCF